MMRLVKNICLLLVVAIFALNTARAQQPTPPLMVVQAANSAASVAVPAPALPAQNSISLQAAMKSLQEIKAVNAETLKKQEAAIEQLEELQKAAQQIKIFTRRTSG